MLNLSCYFSWFAILPWFAIFISLKYSATYLIVSGKKNSRSVQLGILEHAEYAAVLNINLVLFDYGWQICMCEISSKLAHVLSHF